MSASITITIKIDPSELEAALERVQALMADKRPITRRVKGVMERAAEENFDEQGRPKWIDLKPATKKAREKRGTWPGSILVETGQLASSIEGDFDKDSAWTSSNKKYAATHQFGDDERNIDARPFLDLTDDDWEEIADIVQQEFDAAIAG